MLLTVLCAAASALRGAPTAANMNAGGAYLVANADGSSNAMWNSSFANRPNAKFFEVLAGPVSTRYGEVFWEGLDAVPLPADVVARYDGKTIAIVGYEQDQVIKGENGTEDRSVPIYWAYNHHVGRPSTSPLPEPRSAICKSAGRCPPNFAPQCLSSPTNPRAPPHAVRVVAEGEGRDDGGHRRTQQQRVLWRAQAATDGAHNQRPQPFLDDRYLAVLLGRQRRRVAQILPRLPRQIRAALGVAHALYDHPDAD